MAAKVSLLGMMTEKDKKRILAKCDGDIFGDECVLWRGETITKNKKGAQHGRTSFRAKKVLVHRLLYHNFVKNLTDSKMHVLHRCESNGQCVCLRHLYVGTHLENMADKRIHGTETSKLSEADVIAIRRRCEEGGETQLSRARELGVSTGTISMIVNRKMWKWVK